MTKIELTNMRFYANHGCFEQEQVIGTNFRVDLWLTTDTLRAELSDNIADTVNYLEVYNTVKCQMAVSSHLLEHVARRIGEAVLSQFIACVDVTVKVSKLNPPLGGQLESVSIELSVKR